MRAGGGMSRVEEEPVLAAPGRDAALTAAVLSLTAVVFALVADHGILAHIQHVDDAWLRLMVSSRSAPVTAIARFLNLLGLVYVTLPVRIAIAGFLALRRRWWHLAAFVSAVVLSEILIGTLKGIYDRTRPPGSLVATSGASGRGVRSRRRPDHPGRGHRAAGHGLARRLLAGPAPGCPGRRRPARAAVGRGGLAAPGRDRPPLPASRQRDGRPGRPPVIADFGFSEVAATPRQMDLDVAELLASLAALVGEDRATSAAAEVLGGEGVARSVPLLQPLALSAGTRRAVAGQDGLLTRTRAAAAAASGQPAPDLARVQRVRPKTLLMIAAATAVFYFVLPKLAQVGDDWRAFQSADWIWLPVIIAFSALTYLASAVALLGSVSVRLPFGPTVLIQGASSFVNRVSPSNVGGMALNVRFLQKSGVEPSAGVAAVGVNALAGFLVHAALLVIFFTWAGRSTAHAFKLPSSSKLLVILAVVAAVIGIVMATRQGRRFAARKLLPSVRSSLASLGRVARSPARLALLFGGSALVTLAYIGGLVASVEAFGGGAGIAPVGAVYLGAALVAAASPTPGGIGAFETAAAAGLTGVGISSGAAVSAVLTYRLATYWLPVLPGWISWQLLQRMDYI